VVWVGVLVRRRSIDLSSLDIRRIFDVVKIVVTKEL
jgi:hypothetical protein